jgi:SAM-dependent methyltransferase
MSFSDPDFVKIYEQIDGDRTLDIDFYRDVASQAGDRPVLEAGCGSGRILLRLLASGTQVEGFDPSSAMLEVLRSRAEQQGGKVNVWQGDFSSVATDYGAVISPFNSVMHLLDQDAQIDAFSRVHKALDEGGIFAFDIVNPYTLDIYDDSRQFESSMIDSATGDSIEIWRWFEHDPISQLGRYHREFIRQKETVRSVIDFRWSYPTEISLLLKLSGFRSSEVFGGFTGEMLTEDSTSQVWIARK